LITLFLSIPFVLVGITPEDIRAEIRKDANGMLRKRVINGSGSETWVII
jgi:hypothetical protein